MPDIQDVAVREALLARAQKAVENPDVPKLYANGAVFGLSNADAYVVFERNGIPVAMINLSYTLAKTLQRSIGAAMADFESKVERKILTTHEIARALQDEGDGDGD